MRFSWKSTVAVFAGILALGLIASVHRSQKVYAQSSTNLVLYDNFDERFLSPVKWSPYGPSELHFSNPAPIRSIATEFTVRRTSAMACPSNTTLYNSHAHTILQGTFFNSGSGNPTDDVQGLLFFDHDVSSPQGVLNVIGLMYWQGQFFGGVGLGTINEGQKVIAQLSWDQPNHQFVASWTDVLTSTKSEALMPYNMPDTALAATPDKLIGIRTWVPNCLGTQMLVTDMDTTFDRVWIGR